MMTALTCGVQPVRSTLGWKVSQATLAMRVRGPSFCGAFGVEEAHAEVDEVGLHEVQLWAVGHRRQDQWTHLCVQRQVPVEQVAQRVRVELVGEGDELLEQVAVQKVDDHVVVPTDVRHRQQEG